MDAHDEGSKARHAPGEPGGPGEGPPADPHPLAGPRPPADPHPLAGPRPPADPHPLAGPRPPADPHPLAGPRPPVDSHPPTGPGPLAEHGQPLESPTGIAALSLGYRIAVAVALAVVAIGVCAHLGMTFLHVAPANTVTREHGKAVDEWIYPEFEQNWKLFAPNPLQQNVSVQVRAQVRGPDGMTLTTGWYDLSAEDGRAIDGNLLPSHTQQNELRRAWDFFVATHDSENRPVGLRGSLSESYLRRIAVLRLDRADAVRTATGGGGVVERVQFRSRTSNVPPPEWSREKVSTAPSSRELPWWKLPRDEAEGGVR
ncbi:DUF5819 family protein [Streptomyces sp. NPDC002788]